MNVCFIVFLETISTISSCQALFVHPDCMETLPFEYELPNQVHWPKKQFHAFHATLYTSRTILTKHNPAQDIHPEKSDERRQAMKASLSISMMH